MNYRQPQRSYSHRALEAWFARLQEPWEGRFNAEELDWGRRFYRATEVRSTELLADSAIIHFRRGKDPLYVVVDWNGSGPEFRISDPKVAPGRGLGVAGMYELEECIADEVPPVEDAHSVRPAPQPVAEAKPAQADPAPHGRRLCVRFSGSAEGLLVESGWAGPSAKETTDWGSYSLRKLNRWEREQWIGFTARARRSNMRQGSRTGVYRIDESEAIAAFFAIHWPQWKRAYGLTWPPSLRGWQQGVQLLKPVLRASTSGPDTARFSISFDGLGDDAVPLREALLRNPGKPQFVPGKGIFQVDPQLLANLNEWKGLLANSRDGQLPRYHVFSATDQGDVPLIADHALQQWRDTIRKALTEARDDAASLPSWLRPYQRKGVAWLEQLRHAGCHALLADEMGLGKTIQTLCYLDQAACLGHKPALIVCPASVLPIWQEELDRHFPKVPVKVLRKDCPFEAQDKPSACLWLASYTQLRRHRSALAAIEFDHAVLDEAQNIKNPDAKVTHACLAIRARHRLALTGTPMENRPLDLWTLFRFLMPGLLGNRSRFETQQRSDPNFISSLRARLRPFILRRLKLAVATDLPPKVEVTLHCPLTETQRRLYTAACSRASNSISAELSTAANQQRMHLFALLTELRQICCDPGLKQPTAAWQQSGKLNQLIASMHDPVASGSRIVVFSQFVRLLQRARAAVRACFPDVPQFQLTGATRKRAEVVQRFTSSDGPAVFFVSLKAGGTGLNLQAADYLFLLDPWWNPAAEAQAIDRIHRIGQQNRVFIYRLITKGTIEDRVELLKSNKAALLQSLLPENAADQSLWEHFQSLDALIQLDDTVKSSAEG